MKKILMILTSHRLDGLKLCLGCLEKGNQGTEFDKVVFLLNGVEGGHLAYIQNYIATHTDVSWDSISGPRGRSECISSLENQCVEKYPDSIYFKIDEDIFVPEGWAYRMIEAYEAHAHLDNLALITPLIPNNAQGLSVLLNDFYPESADEYRKTWGEDPSNAAHGRVWKDPYVAGWAIEKWIDLESANATQRALIDERGSESRYQQFSNSFSVGCICWDYRHWTRMGGVPAKDEPEWCAWIEENGQTNILDCSMIVQHYSFFVQQDWLDRSHILEELRRINLPATLSSTGSPAYWGPWLVRMVKQLPTVIPRKLKALIGGNS